MLNHKVQRPAGLPSLSRESEGDDTSPKSINQIRKHSSANPFHQQVVNTLHSRAVGIVDDPRRGCQKHAERYVTTVRAGPHSKRSQLSHGKAPLYEPDPAKPSCPSCEACIEYESWLKDLVDTEASKAFLTRRKRGSRFAHKDAVFSIGGVVHRSRSRSSVKTDEILNIAPPAASLTPEEAFGLLSPPINYRSAWKDALSSSAAKLYFVLSHCRRTLDNRMNEDSDVDSRWYLTEKEFEKLLFSSGVDWMERPQIFQTYKELDLNKSGCLHVSELCAVLQAAEEVCKDILNGLCDPQELRSELIKLKASNRFEASCSILNMLP